MMIRTATVEDVPQLIELGKEFFDMTDLGRVTAYDPDSAGQCFNGLIRNEQSVIFVVETDGKVIGGAGATICPFYFNRHDKIASEFFWFISKKYRGGRIALDLFKTLEKWAKDNGANIMGMVALGSNYGPVSAYYERKGYFRQETSFMRRF